MGAKFSISLLLDQTLVDSGPILIVETRALVGGHLVSEMVPPIPQVKVVSCVVWIIVKLKHARWWGMIRGILKPTSLAMESVPNAQLEFSQGWTILKSYVLSGPRASFQEKQLKFVLCLQFGLPFFYL
jgi:hypothetical protein